MGGAGVTSAASAAGGASPLSAEREIAIQARPQTVYGFFVDPERLMRWKGIDGSPPQPSPSATKKRNLVMAKYLFIYHGGSQPETEEAGKEVMAAWMQ